MEERTKQREVNLWNVRHSSFGCFAIKESASSDPILIVRNREGDVKVFVKALEEACQKVDGDIYYRREQQHLLIKSVRKITDSVDRNVLFYHVEVEYEESEIYDWEKVEFSFFVTEIPYVKG